MMYSQLSNDIQYTDSIWRQSLTITIVPAYRVVAKFARQYRTLAYEESVNSLERDVREYVRSLLSQLHPSLVDLGERSVITQMGDPIVDDLVTSLRLLDKDSPKSIAEKAFLKCSEVLPESSLDANILLFPGDGSSRVLVNQMRGVLGFSLSAQLMLVFLWPTDNWKDWLKYTVTHEYVHLLRNLRFPRAISSGRLVFMNTQEPETLLDALVVEGIADTFASNLFPKLKPQWSEPLSPKLLESLWHVVHRRLHVSDTLEIRRILFGDNDRIPPWTGYSIGYQIISAFLKNNPGACLGDLVSLPAKDILSSSGYPIHYERQQK